MKKEDNIDYAVGIELIKKVGCYVEKGETIAYIYADDKIAYCLDISKNVNSSVYIKSDEIQNNNLIVQ